MIGDAVSWRATDDGVRKLVRKLARRSDHELVLRMAPRRVRHPRLQSVSYEETNLKPSGP